MKLLFVFLACIAAANAYSCTYYYYSQRKFEVYPATSVYCFSIRFKTEWCSTRYYDPILKVYPDESCGEAGWTEKSVDDVVDEVKNLLKESLAKISREMVSQRIAWYNYLYTKTYEYMDAYKKFITRYYDYRLSCVVDANERAALIRERDDRIAAYNRKLYQMKYDALTRYNKILNDKLNLIISYHAKLVENARKCLETRLTKIAEFTKALEERISAYVAKFYQYKVAVVNCQVNYYQAILQRIYCTKSTTAYYINYVVGYYRNTQLAWARSCTSTYASNLYTFKSQLIGFYRCAYKCYMSFGCLRFYQKSYYTACAKLGAWYKYSTKYTITRYCLGPFRYCFRGACYRGLKTCDLGKLNKSAADLEKEMKEKMEESIKTFSSTFYTWKSKWIQYHLEYVEKYCQIIKERHDFIYRWKYSTFVRCNGSTYLTYYQRAELSKLAADLKTRKDDAVAKYKELLYQRIYECVEAFSKSITEYRTKTTALITSVIAKYNACLSKRTAAIAAYKKKLEDSRDAQRTTFYNKMWDAKVKHWEQYNEILEKFHGKYYYNYYYVSHSRSAYASKLINYCDVVMSQFDSYWAEVLPKLVTSYACCYRCSAAFCLPGYSYGSYFRWSVCMPTTTYYTYYYRQYCYSLNWKVSNCGNYYVY